MLSPCSRCAERGASCCTGNQIFLTSGDIRRITAALHRNDFYLFEPADPVYTESGDDPLWTDMTIGPDGKRRVLKRVEYRNCILLGPSGCVLPMEKRPLVCRLYPFAYTTARLGGIDETCPVARHENPQRCLDLMGMSMENARKWHRLIMGELFSEFGLLLLKNETESATDPELRPAA